MSYQIWEKVIEKVGYNVATLTIGVSGSLVPAAT